MAPSSSLALNSLWCFYSILLGGSVYPPAIIPLWGLEDSGPWAGSVNTMNICEDELGGSCRSVAAAGHSTCSWPRCEVGWHPGGAFHRTSFFFPSSLDSTDICHGLVAAFEKQHITLTGNASEASQSDLRSSATPGH